jgi:hypothetical protein
MVVNEVQRTLMPNSSRSQGPAKTACEDMIANIGSQSRLKSIRDPCVKIVVAGVMLLSMGNLAGNLTHSPGAIQRGFHTLKVNCRVETLASTSSIPVFVVWRP